ncbi:hypothetical protein DMENIID0001_122490 [Sergentomyia squamirostris]
MCVAIKFEGRKGGWVLLEFSIKTHGCVGKIVSKINPMVKEERVPKCFKPQFMLLIALLWVGEGNSGMLQQRDRQQSQKPQNVAIEMRKI